MRQSDCLSILRRLELHSGGNDRSEWRATDALKEGSVFSGHECCTLIFVDSFIREGTQIMYKRPLQNILVVLFVALTAIAAPAQSRPLEIDAGLHPSFSFVAYGDTRFTDPADTAAAEPEGRPELVRGNADVH